jgi:hypothetical protein
MSAAAPKPVETKYHVPTSDFVPPYKPSAIPYEKSDPINAPKPSIYHGLVLGDKPAKVDVPDSRIREMVTTESLLPPTCQVHVIPHEDWLKQEQGPARLGAAMDHVKGFVKADTSEATFIIAVYGSIRAFLQSQSGRTDAFMALCGPLFGEWAHCIHTVADPAIVYRAIHHEEPPKNYAIRSALDPTPVPEESKQDYMQRLAEWNTLLHEDFKHVQVPGSDFVRKFPFRMVRSHCSLYPVSCAWTDVDPRCVWGQVTWVCIMYYAHVKQRFLVPLPGHEFATAPPSEMIVFCDDDWTIRNKRWPEYVSSERPMGVFDKDGDYCPTDLAELTQSLTCIELILVMFGRLCGIEAACAMERDVDTSLDKLGFMVRLARFSLFVPCSSPACRCVR